MPANSDYTFIVQQLEKMSTKIDEISKEVQQTNIEMTKLGGMKHVLSDFKTWKDGISSAVNADDLREMKSALSEVKKHEEDIDLFEREMDDMKTESSKDKNKIEKLEVFKTQVVTVGSIVVILLGTAITIVGWYLS